VNGKESEGSRTNTSSPLRIRRGGGAGRSKGMYQRWLGHVESSIMLNEEKNSVNAKDDFYKTAMDAKVRNEK
jgi:hypothetical protein